MTRFAISILLFIITVTPALAEQTVVGTGHPAQDVENVQAAVDAGGLILLRGDFNFGLDGRVKISKNTRLMGESDATGEPTTTIKGGFWTFYCPLPVKGAPPSKKGPLIKVRSIHFIGAKGTPLHFPHAGGVDVSDCTISEMIPQEISMKWADGDTLPFQAGIVVGNRLESPKRMVKRAVRGTVRIENNRFFMESDAPNRTLGIGIMVDWTWAADITIAKNVIHRASRNGIQVLDNTLDDKGRGTITIDGNSIITPDTGIPHPNKYGPNGIEAGWYMDTSGGVDFSRNNRMSLSGNRVEGRGDNSTGLLLYANDVVATCNDIIMGSGTSSLGIVQTGSRGFFANNRIRGEARYAIYCHQFEALKASSNTFAWTEINDFTGIKGQVYLRGNVNVIIGHAPSSLVDKGKGNRVVEAKPCALPEVDPEGESWEPVDDL